MIRSLILALGLALVAQHALAQGSPEEVARAKAEGDALLATAGAQDLFINESAEGAGAILLRHKASGFRCVLNPGKPINRVMLFSQPRGDDVGCTTQTISDSRTFYITRAPEMSADIALATAAQGILARFPGAKGVAPSRQGTPTFALPANLPVPPSRTAVFRTPTGDERVTVGKVGEWLVKYRFSSAPGVAVEGGPLDLFWTTAVLDGQRYRAANAASLPTPAAVTEGPPPPSPAQIASARALGDAILASSGAAGHFVNQTTTDLASLRHTASGLVCRFHASAVQNRIELAPGRDDAACVSSHSDGTVRTLRAARRAGRTNLEQEIRRAVAAVTAENRTRPYTGPRLGIALSKDGREVKTPDRRVERFEFDRDGRAMMDRVDVALVDGWLIEQRTTAPVDPGMSADLGAEMRFVADLQQFAEARAAARGSRR